MKLKLTLAFACIAIGCSAQNCSDEFVQLYGKLVAYNRFNGAISKSGPIDADFVQGTKEVYAALSDFKTKNAACPLYQNYLAKPVQKLLQINLNKAAEGDRRSEYRQPYFYFVNFLTVLYDEYLNFQNQKSIDSINYKLQQQIDQVNGQLTGIINAKIQSLDSVLKATAGIVSKKSDSVYNRVVLTNTSLDKTIKDKTDTVSKILTAYSTWYLGGGLHTNRAISVNMSREKEFKFFKSYYLALTSLALFYRDNLQSRGAGAMAHLGVGSANFALQPIGIIYFDKKVYYSFQTTVYNNGLMISVSYNKVLGGGLALLIGLREKAFIPRRRKT